MIARNSSFVYKGRAVDVRQVAKDLGVRYVLEGSVRRAGERLRITAQFVDGSTGVHLSWANISTARWLTSSRLSGSASPPSVAMIVEPHIQLAEIARVAARTAEKYRSL